MRNNTAYYTREFAVLSSLGTTQLTQVGAAVGAVLSISSSNVLHYLNLTGRELNGYFGNVQQLGAARSLMRSLFSTNKDTNNATYFSCVAAVRRCLAMLSLTRSACVARLGAVMEL